MATLQGRVIALTGGASGIGLATAKLLASRGAILSLADTNQSGLDTAINSLAGDKHISTVVDVRDSSQVNSWIQKTSQQLGQLDSAVNAAGVVRLPALLADETDENWDFIMGVNARGVFNCCRAQINHMKDGGSIVNVSSVAGLIGSPSTCVYSASKHAVIGLTKTLARELGARNIRANCVAPGVVATAMIDGVQQLMGSKVPTVQQALNRQADPEEIANVIAFLLSSEASFVTGSTYTVDGGWTC